MQMQNEVIVKKNDSGPYIESMGNVYRIIVTGEETQGQFSMMEAFVEPGDGGQYHLHEREYESFLITEGEMVFFDDDKKISAPKGSLIVCPPGSTRGFRNESNTLAKMMIFYTPPGIENMIKIDGKAVEPHRPRVQSSNKAQAPCSVLSKQFGITDFAKSLPEPK
ncbi:cupin domain-containing protein [Catenovulum sp. SM1970]|uniref:cupin domain-containing protein n=1 Tax=Marinifaba aquimaris TaxID=2741323 RepID=UPI0015746998|nr:cupin domain-containing protein [Marinifaba aquimaris]NTS76762.1 cupin domain-containing protein [Marinifaba aquimaris]